MKMITAYPNADTFSSLDTISIRPFLGTGPNGITVHYTADSDLERVKRDGIGTKIGYHLIISKDGKVHQTSRLDMTVNHAGKATWQGLSPNRSHIAISLLSWGRLDADKKSWNGTLIPDAVFRAGYWWDGCTKEQETALITACRYFISKCHLPLDSICGHDECALPKGRKIDPGNVMTLDMSQLRRLLWP